MSEPVARRVERLLRALPLGARNRLLSKERDLPTDAWPLEIGYKVVKICRRNPDDAEAAAQIVEFANA